MIEYGDPANINAEMQVKRRLRLRLIAFAGGSYTILVLAPTAWALIKMLLGVNPAVLFEP